MSIKRPVEPFSPAGGMWGFRERDGRWLVLEVRHEEERAEMIACINLAPKLAEALRWQCRQHDPQWCGPCDHCKLIAEWDAIVGQP